MAYSIRKYSKIFEKVMYGDKVTIYRYGDKVNEDGSTSVNKNANPVEDMDNIKCKFSFKYTDNPMDSTEDNKPMNRIVSLHCGLEYNILEGDYIIGTRKDELSGITQTIKGQCNKPNRVGHHQEILIAEMEFN